MKMSKKGFSKNDHVQITKGRYKGVKGTIFEAKKSPSIYVDKPDPRVTGLYMVYNVDRSHLKKID